MKKPSHLVEYGLIVVLDVFFHILPFRVAVFLGEQLGVCISTIIHKRNRLILDNLTHAFPSMSELEKKRVAKCVWKNLGRTAVEFILLPRMLQQPENHPIRWEGVEHLDKANADGKGVILLAAHFTNWEILGAFVQSRFHNFMAIARPMHNPHVEKWVQRKRSQAGTQIILHREAVKASLRWIKQKNIIGILVDQNLYTGGVFVDFFGRPAATTTLPALLHARTGAPVLIIYGLRDGDGFRAIVTPPITALKLGTDQQVIEQHTQEISRQFEVIIKRYPECWFWIHNRWKRKQ